MKQPELFDDQADHFDRRAGLPTGVAEEVAKAIVEMAGLGRGCGIVEVGTGTGEIGIHLDKLTERYLGFDRSLPMLRVFRSRNSKTALVQADGNGPWPVRPGSVQVVFGSRSLHYLSPDHLAAEAMRISAPGGIVLFCGGIRREEESVKEIMKRRMNGLLKEKGYTSRGGAGRAWGAEMERLGWSQRGSRIVASWEVTSTPLQSLSAWQGKSGLGGWDIPINVKSSILQELRVWAEGHFGSLSQSMTTTETYVLKERKMVV